MKILFVVKSKAIETLGTMYLSAIARRGGHDTRIVALEDAFIVANTWRPELVGMSVLTGNQVDFIQLAGRVRNVLPESRIIVGSHHATYYPQDFEPHFDHVVSGEAENWFANYLGIDEQYPDIDDIPWPYRGDFPDMKIRDFISTRGCPWGHCKYCYNDRWNKMFPDIPKLRIRSVDDFIAEIKSVNPEFAYFQDSSFGISLSWLKEFSEKFKPLGIPFHCHLSPKQVTIERIRLLKEANCYSLRTALETASPSLRKLIGRQDMDNDGLIEISRLLRNYDINFMLQNILALPTATIEDDLATLELNIKCQADYAWASIFSPYPGTELGDMCKENGWYKGDYSDITDCFFDRSVLEFPDEYKDQTYLLQKVFALAVYSKCMPDVKELTKDNIYKYIHRAMRKIGDGKLYAGVI